MNAFHFAANVKPDERPWEAPATEEEARAALSALRTELCGVLWAKATLLFEADCSDCEIFEGLIPLLLEKEDADRPGKLTGADDIDPASATADRDAYEAFRNDLITILQAVIHAKLTPGPFSTATDRSLVTMISEHIEHARVERQRGSHRS